MYRVSRLALGSLVVCFFAAHAIAEEKPKQVIKGFGTVVDPDGDCQIKEENGKVTIVVPKTHHDLTYTDDYTKLNSPRILQDAKGNFRIEVKVLAFELPGDKASSGGKYSFVSAGLLIWQDDRNFIRMDRAAVATRPFVWVERFQDGKSVSRKLADLENNKDTYLRAMRKADKFTFETSADGKDWTEVQVEEQKLAESLKVGVLAINTTVEPFSATFDDLKLSQDAK